MASRIMRAREADAGRVMDEVLASITGRAAAGPYLPDDVATTPGAMMLDRATTALSRAERAAEEKLIGSVRNPTTAFDQAADERAAELAMRAPKVEGEVNKELAEATKDADALAATLRTLDEQDRQIAGSERQPDPVLAAADDAAREGEAMARAYEAAAVCSIGRL
jgi:hypothetical protein